MTNNEIFSILLANKRFIMDLNTFLPIAKKFGLIVNKQNNGIVEFYIEQVQIY